MEQLVQGEVSALSSKHAFSCDFVPLSQAHLHVGPVMKLHEGFGEELLEKLWVCTRAFIFYK